MFFFIAVFGIWQRSVFRVRTVMFPSYNPYTIISFVLSFSSSPQGGSYLLMCPQHDQTVFTHAVSNQQPPF